MYAGKQQNKLSSIVEGKCSSDLLTVFYPCLEMPRILKFLRVLSLAKFQILSILRNRYVPKKKINGLYDFYGFYTMPKSKIIFYFNCFTSPNKVIMSSGGLIETFRQNSFLTVEHLIYLFGFGEKIH